MSNIRAKVCQDIVRSLTARLTLLSVGATLAILIVVAFGVVVSSFAAFRQNVNVSLHPAFTQVVEEMTDQRRAGHSIGEAARIAQDRLGQPNLYLYVYDNHQRVVFDGWQPRPRLDQFVAGFM